MAQGLAQIFTPHGEQSFGEPEVDVIGEREILARSFREPAEYAMQESTVVETDVHPLREAADRETGVGLCRVESVDFRKVLS